jgi:hypothetical protein
MIKSLVVSSLLLAAVGCAGTEHSPYYTFRADASVPELVPLAEAASKANGYTIAQEDLKDSNDGAFVAVKPGNTSPMLVQVAVRSHMVRNTVVCTQRCLTTFQVTPLGYVGDRFATLDHVSTDDANRARDLLQAIADGTMQRRALEIP